MGIKSTLHFNSGDHHAQNPNASREVKEGQKKAKEAKEIATMVRNALNHIPFSCLVHPPHTRFLLPFCIKM